MVTGSSEYLTWTIGYPKEGATPSIGTLTLSGAMVQVTAISNPKELRVPPGDVLLPGETTSVSGVWMSLDAGMNTIFFGKTPPSTAGQTPSSNLIPQSTSEQTDESAAYSTSSPASRPSSDGSGLSSGAIAGIVIGCIAVCALAAGFVFWFCARRRNSFRSQHAQAEEYMLPCQEKGSFPKIVAATGAITPTGTFSQPLEDKAITGDISKISNAIKNHVQSYYHLNRVGSGLIDNEDLHALGSDLPVSLATLTSLMSKAATREMTLRFVIAWVIISKMQPSKDSSKSFLPPEIAQGYEAIVREYDENQALPLVANWRVMTAESMNSKYAHTSIDASDSRYASIQASLTTLDRVLQPFADPRMNNEERKRNLEEILKRSALFAYTLFSQPSTWRFEWQEGHDVTAGELCIFPALMQVADETGQQIDPPRPFNDAIVRRLDA